MDRLPTALLRSSVVAVASVAFACGVSVLDPLKGDVFVLESIAGAKLPATYSIFPQFGPHLIADTIALKTTDSGERRSTYDDFQFTNTRRNRREVFSYARNGDRIEISFPCPPDAACRKPPHLIGRVNASSFVVDSSALTLQPLVYRKL
jgi:hypothetical protein